jgi:arylsulfatase A
MRHLLPTILILPLLVADGAETRHYWDMDSVNGGGVPIDVIGGLNTSAGANLDLSHSAYGAAGGSGGAYLKTTLGTYGVPLTADVYSGSAATAMVFGGNFAISYWSFNDASDGDQRGPRIFDNLADSASGIHLSATDASPSILNCRMDDDGVGSVLSKDAAPSLSQPANAWIFVVINVDRSNDAVEVFFNGSSQAGYDISALTGTISPTQDLQIGAINGGSGAGGLQSTGLDDLAFYEGILSTQEIADLNSGTITPDDLHTPTPPPDEPTGLGLVSGNGSVTLDWDDNNEPDLSGYRIYRRTEPSEPLLVGTATASTYIDYGLHNGFTYFYFVTATNNSGAESGGSNEVGGTPNDPGAGGLPNLSGTHFEDYAGFPHLAALPGELQLDGDADGEADELEYALGSDLSDPGSRGSSTLALGPGDGSPPTLTWHERISSPGVHCTVTVSTDLHDWSDTPLTEISRAVMSDGRTEQVTVRLDDPALLGAPRLFARITVSDELYVPRFAVPPEATTTTTISMTAGEADLDPRTVEYYFESVSGGNDSGWQHDRLYIDSGLIPGSTCSYRVKLRRVNVADGTPVPGSESDSSLTASATTPSTGNRPNIILFMADDVGYECFDIYGDSDHQTPRISQMAAEGMRFTNFHSQPLCTPSRVQIMSGQYNQRSGTTFGDYEPDKSFATFLKQAGYVTCIAGKWQLDYRTSGDPATNPALPQRIIDLGFDEFLLWNISGGNSSYYGSRYWSPKLYTNPPLPGGNFTVINGTSSQYGPTLVRDFINDFATTATTQSDPFFIYCPLIDPHSPFVTPPGFSGLSTNKQKHQAMVEYMDDSVGITLDLVRNTPALADNTLVIFTGDNGTNTGITTVFNGANYQGGKAGTFDPGTHVPFVAWGLPEIPAGSVSDDLADMSDILPTICDVAGVPIDQDYVIDGRSMRSQLYGLSRDPRRWLYGYYFDSRNPATRRMAWVRNKHFKLYQNGLDHTGNAYVGATRGKLYDVINDERETTPLPTPPVGSRLQALQNEFQAVLNRMNDDADPGDN